MKLDSVAFSNLRDFDMTKEKIGLTYYLLSGNGNWEECSQQELENTLITTGSVVWTTVKSSDRSSVTFPNSSEVIDWMKKLDATI